jgi:hypothetical protein
MEFISAGLSLEQRWKWRPIQKYVGLDITPDLCESKGDNHGTTVRYSFCNCLHQRSAVQSFFQAGKA